ncbi:phage tail tape measure protein [Flavobacterium sp. N2820]|uniref:phage tail tape measure protein n=1 Tax=Flavobacterium sp. N2820 TaxID=2986834 RepID=UPI002224321B|nr:phage tail tape measure protein [Flavobacterium sp. N2820]
MSSQALSYIIQMNSNFDKVYTSFNKFATGVNTGVDNIQRKLNSVSLNAMIQNINSAADGLNSLNDPGMKLSTNMYDLQAITGVAGDKLKEIEGYARQNAKTFGGEASASAESYKLILSQLSPEIAKMPKALQSMGKEVSITSKLMGGDTVAATNVLTTAMNQYQVSLEDPIKASKEMARMNNVMAASAKEGSAELPQIAQALEQSGLAAKTAGVSFEETNAFIQVLDKNGKKGAEGGVALRNVMATLAQGRFLPKDTKAELAAAGVNIDTLTDSSLSLSDRLKPLKGIMNDQALVTKLFGKENSNAAIAMISNTDEANRLTEAVSGTNTAYEQAAIIMESPLEKNKRLKAQVDDFKISLFNGTNGLIGYASEIGNVARDVGNLMPILSGAGTVLSTLTSATKMQALWSGITTTATSIWSGAQMVLNTIMTANPIGLLVVAIGALVALVYSAIKHYDQWGSAVLFLLGPFGILINIIMSVKDHWDSIVNAFKSDGIVGGLKRIGLVLLDAVMKPLQQILEVVAKVDPTGLAQKGLDKIKAFRTANNLVTQGEKVTKGKEAADKAVIKEPKVPGVKETEGGGTGGTKDDESVKKSNQAVATGGTKHNYITITIKELNGLKDVVVSGKDAATKAGTEVADELLRVIAMAGTATG